MKKYFFIISLVILAQLGVALLLFVTSIWGMNLRMDSVYYVSLARFFENYNANKEIISVYLPFHPPLFPFVLSWGHCIGVDPFEGARWLNALLFGFNILLVGIITKKYTGSPWLGLTGALLMLLAPDVVNIHLTAQNDPLFIFFLLLWLLAFFYYLKGFKLSWLLLGTLFVVLASMTRYAGMPVIMAGLWAILFFNQGRSKWAHAVIFTSIPCIFLFFWARYSYIEHSPFQRHFSFHPVGFFCLRETASVFCSYFFACRVSEHIEVLLFLAGAGILLIRTFLWCRTNKIQNVNHPKTIFVKFTMLGAVLTCFYFAGLIFAASFYDAQMSWKIAGWSRYFIPVHMVGIILFCGVMSRFFFQKQGASFKIDTGLIIIIYLLLFYAVGSAQCLMDQYILGGNAVRDPLRYSSIIREIKSMPADVRIYSNNYEAIFVYSGRAAFPLPFVRNPFSLIKNDRYLDQLFEMKEHLKGKKGVLVYFYKVVNSSGSRESLESIQQKIPLHSLGHDSFGEIFD